MCATHLHTCTRQECKGGVLSAVLIHSFPYVHIVCQGQHLSCYLRYDYSHFAKQFVGYFCMLTKESQLVLEMFCQS
jgi:hypothetical protein